MILSGDQGLLYAAKWWWKDCCGDGFVGSSGTKCILTSFQLPFWLVRSLFIFIFPLFRVKFVEWTWFGILKQLWLCSFFFTQHYILWIILASWSWGLPPFSFPELLEWRYSVSSRCVSLFSLFQFYRFTFSLRLSLSQAFTFVSPVLLLFNGLKSQISAKFCRRICFWLNYSLVSNSLFCPKSYGYWSFFLGFTILSPISGDSILTLVS